MNIATWLSKCETSPPSRLRLVCLSHAGGGAASFLRWNRLLPAGVALCPIRRPGRESAYSEPFLRDVDSLTRGTLAALDSLPPLPVAILGHSFGALLAYELAKALAARGTPAELLVVSGRQAPNVPADGPKLAALPEARFIAELDARYGGIPREIREEPELLAMMLPIIRADLTASEAYRYVEAPKLHCPIVVCNGTADRAVSRERVLPWAEHTDGNCEFLEFPGGHFFLFEPSGFIEALRERLLTNTRL